MQNISALQGLRWLIVIRHQHFLCQNGIRSAFNPLTAGPDYMHFSFAHKIPLFEQ